MGDWPISGGMARVQCVPNADPYQVTVATGAGANTKSAAWVELVAATSFDAWLNFYLGRFTYLGEGLVDIAIGAGGSEQIIVNNMYCFANGYARFDLCPVNLFIPAGTRLSAKSQTTYIGTNNVRVNPVLIEANAPISCQGYQVCNTYGANTADSGGTQIDPGGAAETWGAYVLIATLTRSIRGFFVKIGFQNNGARQNASFAMDIATGEAGSEQLIVNGFNFMTWQTGDGCRPESTPVFPINLPIGTKISIRGWSETTDATDRKFDVIIYTLS